MWEHIEWWIPDLLEEGADAKVRPGLVQSPKECSCSPPTGCHAVSLEDAHLLALLYTYPP